MKCPECGAEMYWQIIDDGTQVYKLWVCDNHINEKVVIDERIENSNTSQVSR